MTEKNVTILEFGKLTGGYVRTAGEIRSHIMGTAGARIITPPQPGLRPVFYLAATPEAVTALSKKLNNTGWILDANNRVALFPEAKSETATVVKLFPPSPRTK